MNNDNFRFEHWKVYKDSKELFNEILIIYKKMPYDIKNSIGKQLLSSALSIILNIAEGCGKSSDKELNRFINISMGSIYETFANLDILKDNKILEISKFKILKSKLNSIKKQLGGFKKKLK